MGWASSRIIAAGRLAHLATGARNDMRCVQQAKGAAITESDAYAIVCIQRPVRYPGEGFLRQVLAYNVQGISAEYLAAALWFRPEPLTGSGDRQSSQLPSLA